MLLNHNPQSFLTGDDPFLPTRELESSPGLVKQELTFENHHEGFIGIPHGGLAMGICMDAWERAEGPSYPFRADYRFGGSGVSIGDPLLFTAERQQSDGTLVTELMKSGDKKPYLRAVIQNSATSEVPQNSGKPSEEYRDLPYYRNCFVCGHHRSAPGLQRRFRVHANDGDLCTTSEWGWSSEDPDRASMFLTDGENLHPAVLVSIFDENTAWSGFMLTRSAGLSVRISLTLLRPVKRTERLLFVGRPAGIRGNPRSPRFFKADGTILAFGPDGDPETVAYGNGEWVILEQYTEQIKTNLLPDDDWDWIFQKD